MLECINGEERKKDTDGEAIRVRITNRIQTDYIMINKRFHFI